MRGIGEGGGGDGARRATAHGAVAPGRRWGVLAAAAGARAAVGFQFQALPALGPALAAGLGVSLAETGTLTGLYMAPGVAVALLTGALLQRVAARTALALALACMAAGGALGAWAEGFDGLAAGRLLAGFGGVIVTVAGLKALYDWFPARELALVNAVAAASQPFGMGFALLIFAWLGASADWRFGLLSTGAVAALGFAAALLLVPGAAAAPGAGLRLREALRFPRPEARMLATACLTVSLFVGCFYGFLSLFPAFLHDGGWGPEASGLLLGAFGWAPILAAPAGGWIAGRLRRPAPFLALCILGWGGSTLATGLWGTSLWLLAAMLACGPAPLGWVMSLAGRAAAPERRGMASGVFMAAFFLGGSVMPALAGWIGERAAAAGASGPAAGIAFCGAAFTLSMIPLILFEAQARRAGV